MSDSLAFNLEVVGELDGEWADADFLGISPVNLARLIARGLVETRTQYRITESGRLALANHNKGEG